MEILKPVPDDLLEEYKLCQEKATGLADNIWKTALILGIGSVAGIITLSGKDAVPNELNPWLPIVLSFFAVGILFTWKRLAHRWWSIEHAMFRRMEHIERQSLLRANLYVGYLNNRVKFAANEEGATYIQPFLSPELLADLGRLRDNYEIRGIQPMVWFVIEINIAAWIAFALFACSVSIPAFISISIPRTSIMLNGPTMLKLIVVIGFILWFLLRLRVRWRKE